MTESNGQTTKAPIFNPKNDAEKEQQKHDMEVELILQYSPFQTQEDLLGRKRTSYIWVGGRNLSTQDF